MTGIPLKRLDQGEAKRLLDSKVPQKAYPYQTKT